MTTSLEQWLDDAAPGPPAPAAEGPATEPGRRPWRLAVLAVVPWVAVAALPIVTGADAPAQPGMPSTVASESVATPTPAMTPATVPAGDDDVAAVAALAVRSFGTVLDATPRRHVEDARVVAVTWVRDVAVVRVDAAVIVERAGRWTESRLEHHAVAVRRLPAGPIAVAGPWTVPAPLGDRPWNPTDADRSAATGALSAAGYVDVGRVEMESTASTPDIVRVSFDAVGPGQQEPRRHQALLSTAPWALLGAPVDDDTPTVTP